MEQTLSEEKAVLAGFLNKLPEHITVVQFLHSYGETLTPCSFPRGLTCRHFAWIPLFLPRASLGRTRFLNV